MKTLNYLVEKFSQESTWRGLIAVMTSFGVMLGPDQANAIIAVGLFLIGTINVAKNS